MFVCGKNRWRSPTAEQIFSGRDDCEVLSAGLADESETMLTGELVAWANRIFVMEGRQRRAIEQRFGAELGNPRVVSLQIPDRYQFMDPDLVSLLKRRMAPHWR